ncbi:Hypothetical predicted protein, partial [Paramuricea clavata]
RTLFNKSLSLVIMILRLQVSLHLTLLYLKTYSGSIEISCRIEGRIFRYLKHVM